MWIARKDGQRTKPVPDTVAECPLCSNPVRSACGSIVSWHWKHISGSDCDPWSEPESEWHARWKALFPEECREVVIGPHRADVVTRDEIIELQHSPITGDMITEREEFYGDRLVWIFDAYGFNDKVKLDSDGECSGFRFAHPKKAIAHCKRRTLIDIGGGKLLEPIVWHSNRHGAAKIHDIDWTKPPQRLSEQPGLWSVITWEVKKGMIFGNFKPYQYADKKGPINNSNCAKCGKRYTRHIGKHLCCPTEDARCSECQRLVSDHETVRSEGEKLYYMAFR
jgi:Competence protein CoiA-like family